jgi:hypothetical protein
VLGHIVIQFGLRYVYASKPLVLHVSVISKNIGGLVPIPIIVNKSQNNTAREVLTTVCKVIRILRICFLKKVHTIVAVDGYIWLIGEYILNTAKHLCTSLVGYLMQKFVRKNPLINVSAVDSISSGFLDLKYVRKVLNQTTG